MGEIGGEVWGSKKKFLTDTSNFLHLYAICALCELCAQRGSTSL